MNQTVVGVFRDAQDSQQAVQQLEALGLDHSRIDVAEGSAYGMSAANDHEDGLTRFFKSLFGDGDDARRHTEVARQGAVVTVHAESEDEARRAALILDRYGACDFDGDPDSPAQGFATPAAARASDDELPGGEIGNVRLHSRIVERPLADNDRLRERPAVGTGWTGTAAPMDTPGTGYASPTADEPSRAIMTDDAGDDDDRTTRGIGGADSDRLDTGTSNPITGGLSDTGSSRFRDNG